MEGSKEDIVNKLSSKTKKESLIERYGSSVKIRLLFILITILMIFVCCVIAMSLGPTNIPFTDILQIMVNMAYPVYDVDPSYYDIVVNTRLPRIVLAIITGGSLAMAGCIMQGILRNPLVSPFTLGVSTAAAFGVGIAIMFGPALFGSFYSVRYYLYGQIFSGSSIVTILFAFLFGLVSISFVLLLSRREHVSQSTLVLSGVVISYLFQAGLSFLKYISNDSALRDITLWTMGNLWSASWAIVFIVLPVVILCAIYLEKISIDINTLSAGTGVAKNLGIDVAKLRFRGLLVCTVITCTCLAFTGAIGFIGLMAPHICRRLIGNDNRYLLPASALVGGLILLISDTVARNAFATDVPVGILIYIIGGIFFIGMVLKKDWRNTS